jgi:hypothetical protein
MEKTKNSRDNQNLLAWVPLLKKKGDIIFHGAVIRCIGK